MGVYLNNPKSNGKKKERREGVRLDETVKLLFEVSKELLVKTLNSLFGEDFDADKVEIDKTATEYPKTDISIIRADIFIKITEYKPNHFHIEIETEPSHEIAVRVFEYDIMKAISNWRLSGQTKGVPELFMPKTIVIHIEGSSIIPKDEHEVKIIMADGVIMNYSAKVMRYFDYDKDRLIKENLYTLLPLQVFMLRAELDRMTAKGDKQEQQTALNKAKDLTVVIANEIMNLYQKKELSFYDVDRILLALQEMFTHLNNRYVSNEKLNKEVENMVRTLIDPKLVNKTKTEQATELAKKMLSNNEPMSKIIDYTELTEKQIENIQKSLNK